MQPTDVIDYRYLDFDNGNLYTDYDEFIKVVKGKVLQAIPNWNHNQCLYVASREFISECAAVILCRRITGLL